MTLTEKAQALEEFTATWADGHLAHDVAPHLTCKEAEAITGALAALGADDAAQAWLDAHAAADEPDDDHYRGEDHPSA